MAIRQGLIRVLHAAGGLGLGGTEKTMQILASGLDRERFLPAVFATHDGPRRAYLAQAKVPVFAGTDFYAALSQFKPHIVHIHRAGWPERNFTRPLKLHRGAGGLPAVVETNVFGRLDDTAEAAVIDVHLFVSRFCLERFSRMPGAEPSGFSHRVLYNPVDTGFFARRCPKRAWPGPIAGRLSRADDGKWSSLAIDMLPHALNLAPDLRYLVVGMTESARQSLARLGLGKTVRELPQLISEVEIADFFNSIAVLAHANTAGESFGLVIAEAMAAGLPVITHPSLGERDNAQLELVEHGITGFVAQDPLEYGKLLAKLLLNPGLAREMGEAGRAKAQREFEARAIIRQLEDIYLELTERFAQT